MQPVVNDLSIVQKKLPARAHRPFDFHFLRSRENLRILDVNFALPRSTDSRGLYFNRFVRQGS